MDLTRPRWSWVLDCGRFRLGWMSLYKWQLYGAYTWSWFFVIRYYPIRDDEYYDLQVGGFWQMTVLGLQIGYCYRKDYKSTKNR